MASRNAYGLEPVTRLREWFCLRENAMNIEDNMVMMICDSPHMSCITFPSSGSFPGITGIIPTTGLGVTNMIPVISSENDVEFMLEECCTDREI